METFCSIRYSPDLTQREWSFIHACRDTAAGKPVELPYVPCLEKTLREKLLSIAYLSFVDGDNQFGWEQLEEAVQ